MQADLNRLLGTVAKRRSRQAEQTERELIRNLLGRLDKMIKNVEGIHGLTEGEGDRKELAERQGKEAERARNWPRTSVNSNPRPNAGDKNNPSDQKGADSQGKGNGKARAKGKAKARGAAKVGRQSR